MGRQSASTVKKEEKGRRGKRGSRPVVQVKKSVPGTGKRIPRRQIRKKVEVSLVDRGLDRTLKEAGVKKQGKETMAYIKMQLFIRGTE